MERDFFSSNYSNFNWPISEDPSQKGFRNAQLGALHSIGSHFTNRSDPAIITMPTGSGKTAVLIAAAFLLRPERVLIITPSRLVREQISEQFDTLDVLKKIGAVPETIEPPKVYSTQERITSIDDWEKMREYDVVVGTLPSISPSFDDIPSPPEDLFDLILVDEAHHSPAKTWQSVIDSFVNAKKILLTATPFRRDNKEIKGRLIYAYSLSKAYQDGIFGEISYVPVDPNENSSISDIAIAKEASRQFKKDKEDGYDHRLMVRTDSKKRATELLTIYEENTDLKLKMVKGEHSLRHVKTVIKNLSEGDLDGIVCVDMMGEGFDFPSLKIAAIHSPHKSLAVTLQFVGRFARTSGSNLGPAKFIAVPSEIKIESERLYKSGAIWQEMIANLSSIRVEKESTVREALDSFENIGEYDDEEFSDISLYTIEPYHRIKIYSVSGVVDLKNEIEWPRDIEVIYERFSDSLNAIIYLTKEVKKSSFSKDDRFNNITHDAFIIYHDTDADLIFLCFTRRTEGFYEFVMQGITDGVYKILSLVKVNRALNGLKNHEFFSVGMRSRSQSSTSESYRMISGSCADKAIQPSDARLYHRGHSFGGAEENGVAITIGISSASKVWSNKYSQIPSIIQWCKSIAKKIDSDRNEDTECGLDILSVGEEIQVIPDDVMYCDWDKEVYKGNYIAEYFTSEGRLKTCQLLDFDLGIDYDSITQSELVFAISVEDERFEYKYSIAGGAMFECCGDREVFIKKTGSTSELSNFLSEYPIVFFTGSLSSFFGVSFMKAHDPGTLNYRLDLIQSVDWAEYGVDVKNECKPASSDGISIQDYLSEELKNNGENDVVYFDHGTGEIADFIAVQSNQDNVLVKFYHCKKSGGVSAGNRVEDAYEVCGQSIKCTIYTRPSKLFQRISYRFTEKKGMALFIKGDLETLRGYLCDTPPAKISFRIIAVQPGISRESITEKLGNILASVDDYLVRDRHDHFHIMGS
jgi:superfamily II DNA or RNA helicase